MKLRYLNKEKRICISKHALKRLEERLGDIFWKNKRIKELSINKKKEILNFKSYKIVKIVKLNKFKFKIITDFFTAIVGVTTSSIFIKTVYISDEYTNKLEFKFSYKIKEIINKETEEKIRKKATSSKGLKPIA